MKAAEALAEGKWAASIYYSYQSMVNSAKALLTAEKTKTNTHASILKDFDRLFVASNRIVLSDIGNTPATSFEELVLQLNKNEPSEVFAKVYLEEARNVLKVLQAHRNLELQEA